MDTPNYEKHLLSQLNHPSAQKELRDMALPGINWVARTNDTMCTLLPRLGVLAERIKTDIPVRINAVVNLLEHIREGLPLLEKEMGGDIKKWREKLEAHVNLTSHMVDRIESQQVSAEVQRLIAGDSRLCALMKANGGSIYPDILIKSYDYSMLPPQDRKKPIDGPCLQGKKNPRPSNVPDGCEIKTNRGSRMRIDAHGAHAGLHLGVTWEISKGKLEITGVWAAYVRIADHTESKRNVASTTVKYSFGHDLFVSLLE